MTSRRHFSRGYKLKAVRLATSDLNTMRKWDR